MNSLLAIFIIFLVFFIGDLVATKTKAIISMIFFGAIVFMIAFWTGLPKTIFADSGLLSFASITIAMFLAHVGTTINVRDFIKEWKTVVIVLFATTAIALGSYFVCQFMIDKYYALAGGPVLAGGMVAYLIMKGVADTLNRPDVAVYAMLVLIFQMFIGIPFASSLLKKEARGIRKSFRDGTLKLKTQEEKSGSTGRKLFPQLPAKYSSTNYILCKLALVALLASFLGKWTGMTPLIFALILGVICREIGFLEENALVKCNGLAFVLAGATVTIFSSLATSTPAMVLSMIYPLLLLLVIGAAIGALVAIITGRLLHFSWQMSVCIALTALFGFPATYQLPTEVAKAVGENEAEVSAIQSILLPKMIIAGIVSVSIVSGVLASIMGKWI